MARKKVAKKSSTGSRRPAAKETRRKVTPSRASGRSSKAARAGAGVARPLVVGGPHARLGDGKPLARELLALYAEMGRLSRATRVEAERFKLREQQDAIGVQIDEVISRTIREDTDEYRDAATALVAASRRIEDAIADIGRVADAIVSAARVVDAVTRVLSAAAGPLTP